MNIHMNRFTISRLLLQKPHPLHCRCQPFLSPHGPGCVPSGQQYEPLTYQLGGPEKLHLRRKERRERLSDVCCIVHSKKKRALTTMQQSPCENNTKSCSMYTVVYMYYWKHINLLTPHAEAAQQPQTTGIGLISSHESWRSEYTASNESSKAREWFCTGN